MRPPDEERSLNYFLALDQCKEDVVVHVHIP